MQSYTYKDSANSLPYFIYTPTTYHVGKAVPLLVMLHGCTQTAEDFAAGTRMNELAERYGFIVVYPQQTSKANRTLCWNWFRSAHQFRNRGEPARIAHIVQTIRQNTTRWTIDSNQIYVVGASAGGAMAVILGATFYEPPLDWSQWTRLLSLEENTKGHREPFPTAQKQKRGMTLKVQRLPYNGSRSRSTRSYFALIVEQLKKYQRSLFNRGE